MADLGFSYPFRKEGAEFPKSAEGNQLISEDMLQLLSTMRGSRLMRSHLGSKALQFIFEPNESLLEENIRGDILQLIAKFEPRVIVRNILFSRSDSNIYVTVQYVVRETAQTESLNFSIATMTP